MQAKSQMPNNKGPGVDTVPADLLSSVTPTTITALCQKVGKRTHGQKIRNNQCLFYYRKRATPRITPITAQVPSSITVARFFLRSYNNMWHQPSKGNYQMFKLASEGVMALMTILQIYPGSWKRSQEYQKNIYTCFVDYKKAFDGVDHDKLEDLGMPTQLFKLVQLLYINQKVTLRDWRHWFKIEKRVWQDCILSFFLFNQNSKVITRKLNLKN